MSTIPIPSIQTELTRLSFEDGASRPRFDLAWPAGRPASQSNRCKVVALHVDIDQHCAGYLLCEALVSSFSDVQPRCTPRCIADDGQRLTIHFFMFDRVPLEEVRLQVYFWDPMEHLHDTGSLHVFRDMRTGVGG